MRVDGTDTVGQCLSRPASTSRTPCPCYLHCSHRTARIEYGWLGTCDANLEHNSKENEATCLLLASFRRPSTPPVFDRFCSTACKRSKTGGEEGLGTRIFIAWYTTAPTNRVPLVSDKVTYMYTSTTMQCYHQTGGYQVAWHGCGLTFSQRGGFLKQPTPGGVPVNTTSPGWKVTNLKKNIFIVILAASSDVAVSDCLPNISCNKMHTSYTLQIGARVMV